MDQFYKIVNKTNDLNVTITIIHVIGTIRCRIEISIAIYVTTGETSLYIATHGTFIWIWKFNAHSNTPDLFVFCFTSNMDIMYNQYKLQL